MVTALDVEISRLEIPHELGKDADLKVPPLHPIWASYPFGRAREQLPPDIGCPGEVKQFDALFLGRTLLFDDGGDEPVAPTGLVLAKKAERAWCSRWYCWRASLPF